VHIIGGMNDDWEFNASSQSIYHHIPHPIKIIIYKGFGHEIFTYVKVSIIETMDRLRRREKHDGRE